MAEYFYERVKETINGHEFKFNINGGNVYYALNDDDPPVDPRPVYHANYQSAWGRVLLVAAAIADHLGQPGEIEYMGTSTGTYIERAEILANNIANMMVWDSTSQAYKWPYDGVSFGIYEQGNEDIGHARMTVDFVRLAYEHAELFETCPFNFNTIWGLAGIIPNVLIKPDKILGGDNVSYVWDCYRLVNGMDWYPDYWRTVNLNHRYLGLWASLV